MAAGPLWVDNELFTTYNPDIEFQGNVDFGAGYLVALGVNNGLKAFLIDPTYVPPVESFRILSVTAAAGGIVLEWESNAGVTYQVQAADALNGAWQDLGSPIIAAGNTASFVDQTPAAAQRFYRVQTH